MSVSAIIYKGEKAATQSGEAKNDIWYLKYLASNPVFSEPIMGWNSSSDMEKQVVIKFSSMDQAVDFAKKQGIDYEVVMAQEKKYRKKSYADNFK